MHGTVNLKKTMHQVGFYYTDVSRGTANRT